VAAVESTARQVPSVVPHGMTSSCGCMAPCGWPQPSPLHPATPYSVRSQGQLPRCPMTLLMRWTSHECLHLPQCLSYPLTACGSMSDANTARAAGCLGTVPGANPRQNTFPGSLAALARLAAPREPGRALAHRMRQGVSLCGEAPGKPSATSEGEMPSRLPEPPGYLFGKAHHTA
jgi:hypothetical protein